MWNGSPVGFFIPRLAGMKWIAVSSAFRKTISARVRERSSCPSLFSGPNEDPMTNALSFWREGEGLAMRLG